MSTHRTDDEYQFPSEEYTTVSESDVMDESQADADVSAVDPDELASAPTDSKPGLLERFPLLGNKRIVLPIVIILVVIIGLVLFRHHHTTRIVSTTPAPVTQQVSVTHTKPNTEARQVQTSSAMTAVMNNELSGMMATVHNNQAQIDELRGQVTQLTTVLQQFQQTKNNANAMLGQVARQLTELRSQLAVLHQHQEAIAAHFKPKPVHRVVQKAKPIVFHIEAVEPGRAWLQDQHHHNRSIRVGNVLPQYGTVIGIDDEQGVVLTSSGKVIRYGTNDS